MRDLRITLVQTALHWENAAANRKHFDELLLEVKPGSTDLVVLPEMFTTGFSMQPDVLAEKMDGPTMVWMLQKAVELRAVITGSLIIQSHGHYYNRLIWMRPDGTYETYDKRHLFSLAGEEKYYTAGQKRLIVALHGWRVCPLVCYDLRFPVWSRNRKDYDLLLYVANWPQRRSYAWKQLLIARAIENQSYVAAVNRVGNDGNQVAHSGDSGIIDPLGEVLFTQSHEPIIKTITLSHTHLTEVRDKFRFLDDGDEFDVD